ncbi:MAG: hypothetical protein ACTS3T_12505 [Almyronema sp.]
MRIQPSHTIEQIFAQGGIMVAHLSEEKKQALFARLKAILQKRSLHSLSLETEDS